MLYDVSDPASSYPLFFHRVPSASLYPEEMLAPWSSNPSQTFLSTHANDYNIRTTTDRKRPSATSTSEHGNWLTEQSHLRPPSLLPPAPQLNRPLTDTTKVECRLISPTLSTFQSMNANSTSTAKSGLLKQVTAQLGDISLEYETLSSPPTSPITPVPSLTNSHRSRSSFAISEGSPCTAAGSPQDHFARFLPQDSDSAMVPPKRMYEANVYSGICNINPPLPKPPLCQDYQLYCAHQPTDLSRGSNFPPPQHLPNSDLAPVPTHMPRPQEVSYIDWDDEDGRKRYYSPLRRIKKSLSDLRAAERFISEAHVRKRINLPPHKNTTRNVPHAQRREADETNAWIGRHQKQPCHSPPSTAFSARDEKSLPRLSSRLRKRPRTTKFSPPSQSRMMPQTKTSPQIVNNRAKNIKANDTSSTPAPPPRDTVIPLTPPSTGKRKRANTTTSEPSREAQKKKKLRLGVVGKLVKRLLGARDDY
ncbi:hypothetical protein AYL99_07205 [Fonsecaea erecta]|uniref:Uncharacterized protein n=1 Tax=Fonsecaea erecta TaxID=1367422 RepID=A0A178ZGE0_9EURO|nr:hypothetical protein AYL99_07205 [Fonsecaea erecta]OAP58115.1 hypothetical protein AYL99_07205 [Fonsecaea erecta]